MKTTSVEFSKLWLRVKRPARGPERRPPSSRSQRSHCSNQTTAIQVSHEQHIFVTSFQDIGIFSPHRRNAQHQQQRRQCRLAQCLSYRIFDSVSKQVDYQGSSDPQVRHPEMEQRTRRGDSILHGPSGRVWYILVVVLVFEP